jgi:hypothetical protein
MKKAIHHFSRWLLIGFEITGILAIIALLGWLGLLWRLTQGPLNVDYLTGYLGKGLSEESGFSFNIGSTELTWRGRFEPLEIRMNRVLIMRTDKTPVLSVDRVNIQLSKRHLLFARIVPRAIEIHGPALRVIRWEDGHFTLNLGEDAKQPAGPAQPSPPGADLIRALLEKLQERQIPLLGGLHEISITDASAFYDDRILHAAWKSRDADVKFTRDRQGIISESNVRLDLDATHTATLHAKAAYDWTTRNTDILAVFSDLVPSLAVQGSETLKDAAGVNLPLKGSVAVRFDPDFVPAEVRFVLGTDPGTFSGFGLYTEPVPVQNMYVSGHVDLKTLAGEVEKCRLDLGGPMAEATVTSIPQNGKAIVSVRAALTNMPISDLKHWWPEKITPSPREWVTQRLSKGMAQRATLDLDLAVDNAPGHATAVSKVGGRIDFTGISVDYFPPLKPVSNVDGFAVYDNKTFDLDLHGGQLADMKVKTSKIHIYDLDAPDAETSKIDVSLSLHGPLKTAFEVLQSKPLEYPKKLGLNTTDVKGTADLDLGFRFPLKTDLALQEVQFTAKAQMDDVLMANMVAGMPLAGGPMKLDLDNKGMTVDGKAQLNGVPVAFKWLRSFDDKAKVAQKIDATLSLDGPMLQKFGAPASLAINGQMPSEVSYILGSDRAGVLTLKGDLKALGFELPQAGFKKTAGTPGSLAFLLRCIDGKPREMSGIDLQTGGAVVKGELGFDNAGISRASLTHVILGDTDAAVTASKDKTGQYAVHITGKQADFSSFLQGDDKPGDEAEAAKTSSPFDISIQLGRILTGKGKYIDKAVARLQRNAWRRIDRLEMDGVAGAGAFSIRYLPVKNGHSLSFVAQDAGAALSALGFSDSIRRGKLAVSAVPAPGGPRDLAGTAVLTDFTLVNAPVLARLFNALSLTGLLELMSSRGMEFHKAKTEFFWVDRGPPAQQKVTRALRLKDGETSGSSLGLTFEGYINEWAKTYDLNGTIIPVSDVNKLVASIPLFGNIITGGSGSVFAATYVIKGPKSDPSVIVNPVSILAPGLLRKLFFQK